MAISIVGKNHKCGERVRREIFTYYNFATLVRKLLCDIDAKTTLQYFCEVHSSEIFLEYFRDVNKIRISL